MSLEYNYDDLDRRWPCPGWMTIQELDVEWLRCWRLLRLGGEDVVIKYDHRLSDRIVGISRQLLSRQFLHDEHERFVSGEASPDSAEFDEWRWRRFLRDRDPGHVRPDSRPCPAGP